MKLRVTPKIFVVDDDCRDANRISKVLENAGYHVDAETDSREALKRVTADVNGYDILIFGNNMPHLSGGELVERVSLAGFQGKVVMYSDSLSEDAEEAHRAVGADVVLRKPFGPESLLPTIRICTAILTQRRSHREAGTEVHGLSAA